MTSEEKDREIANLKARLEDMTKRWHLESIELSELRNHILAILNFAIPGIEDRLRNDDD